MRQWQSLRTVVQLQEQQREATALETIEHVLASLAQIRERDRALDALVDAIQTEHERLVARLARVHELRCR